MQLRSDAAQLQPGVGLWVVFFGILVVKVFLCFFTGHFDVYRFLVFLQHAIAFPEQDPWSYRQINGNSDFPYPPLLMLLLKGLVALGPVDYMPPHAPPKGILYSLVKLPILIADLCVAWLIVKRTNFSWMIKTYWFSGVIVFHQYYSGQFDIVVCVPLVAGLCWLNKHTSSPELAQNSSRQGEALFYIGYLASVILKPFALLFVPALLASKSRQLKNLLVASVMFVGIWGVFKISQWPYSQSLHYQNQMGEGAVMLLFNLQGNMVAAFPMAYLLMVFWVWYRRITHEWRLLAAVVLCIGATAYHSAGWMTWAAVALPVVLHDMHHKKWHLYLLNLWSVAFILRWTFCPTSPLLDSMSVFTDRFLSLDLQLPMGYFYVMFPKLLGINSFLLFGYLFAIVSAALLWLILTSESRQKPGAS